MKKVRKPKALTVRQLTREQLTCLKRTYMSSCAAAGCFVQGCYGVDASATQKQRDARERPPTPAELKNADALIEDDVIFTVYSDEKFRPFGPGGKRVVEVGGGRP